MTTGVIRGRVLVRDSGAVVPHAKVAGFGPGSEAAAEADEHGEFVLTGVTAGVAMIGARTRGWASATPEILGVDAGEDVTGVRILVDPAYSISGRVVRGELGASAVKVWAQSLAHGGIPTQVLTDETGAFELVGLTPGSYSVCVGGGSVLEKFEIVEVADRDVHSVRLAVRSGVAVTGRIDPPVVAQVALSVTRDTWADQMFDPNLYRARTESDASGRFSMSNVLSGSFVIAAMAADGRRGESRISIGAEDLSGVVIELTPRRTVRGRVVDAAGAPLGGCHVRCSPMDIPVARRLARERMTESDTTAVDGSFAIVGLDTSRYRISADYPGPSTIARTIEVDLDESDQSDVEIVMELPSSYLRGSIVDVDGAPAMGLFIWANQPNDDGTLVPRGHAQTDRHGRFVIERVHAGTYVLVARDKTRVVTEVSVSTDTDVTIQILPRCSLTVAVSRHGAPARGVSVFLHRGTNMRIAENVDGVYAFPDLVDGEFEYVAYGPAGIATGTVRVAAATSLQIDLGDHASVTGIAIDALTGAPLAGLHLRTLEQRGNTDDAGRFQLAQLRPGAHRISIVTKNHLSYGGDSIPYRASPGQHIDLGRIALPAPVRGEPGTFGMTLMVRDEVLQVERITKDGPAARAGIVVGDEVVVVARHRIPDLGAARAKKLLASDNVPIGQTLTIVLANGRSIELTSVVW